MQRRSVNPSGNELQSVYFGHSEVENDTLVSFSFPFMETRIVADHCCIIRVKMLGESKSASFFPVSSQHTI